MSKWKPRFERRNQTIKTVVALVTLPFASAMGFDIHWLRRASDELDSIYQFYKQFANEEVAVSRVGMIIRCVGLLETMPFLGRKDEEFTHIREYRYLVVLTYKVYYFVENNNIYIASIWDCRQGGKAF